MKNYVYLNIFLAICATLSLILAISLICKMTSASTLTNLEASVFAISLSIFTTAIGMIFTIWQASRNLNEQLQMYGALAMRRIVQAINSCKALLLTVKSKYMATRDCGFLSKEVSNEFLENVTGQLSRLTSSILDSKDDWRDILKDVREKADEIDKEFAESVFQYKNIQKELLATKEQLKQATENKPQLEKKLKELEEENRKIRDDLIEKEKKIKQLSSLWPLSSSTSLASGDYYTVSTGTVGWITPEDVSTSFSTTSEFCGDCGNPIIGSPFQCSSCGKALCFTCSGSIATSLVPILCRSCKEKK